MPNADPHLLMAELTLPQPIAGTPAEAVAALATQFILEDLVKGRITFIVAITFRGTAGRIWQLHDVKPTDEVVRALAQREEAQALTVVQPAVVTPEMDGDRCVEIAAECEWGTFDNIVFKKTPAGEMFRVGARHHDGPTRHRWFGVAPKGEVKLWVEGIVGLMGRGRSGNGNASA